MNNKKIPTGVGTVILVIIAITISVFVWKYEKRQDEIQLPDVNTQGIKTPKNQSQQEQSSTSNILLPEVDISKLFQYSKGIGFYGTLMLTGYIDIKQKICNPGDFCTKTVNYVYFVITSTDNKYVSDFLNENKGNSYIGDNSIGLGCYEKNKKRIYSKNYGDNGFFENIVSGNDLQKLLQSNNNNYIRIQLVKPILLGGSDAPECYSHFRQFKVNP